MNKVVHSSLITIVIAVVLYGALALFSDGDEVWQALASLDASVWCFILILSLVNYVFRYLRWHFYVSYHNPVSITHFQHIAIYFAGFSLTMTPGKAGEAMRSLYLHQYGVSNDRSLGAFFVERLMDLITILIMAAFGVSLLSGPEAILACVVTVGIILTCILMIKVPKEWVESTRLFQWLPEKLQGLFRFFSSMLDKAGDLLSFRFLILGLLIGLIAWGCEGYGLYLVMEEFAPEKTEIVMAMAVYGLGILLGALSMSPGGLGASEGVMVYLLIKVGFEAPSAVAITYICRIATLWFAVLLGVITMFVMSLMGLKPQLTKESSENV